MHEDCIVALGWVLDNAVSDRIVIGTVLFQTFLGGNIMQWQLEGLHVTGKYLDDYDVSGTVELSRVKYGGDVSHHVALDAPIVVYGAVRDRVIIDHKNIKTVSSS